MTKAAIKLSALSYLSYLWQMINVGRHQYHSNSGPPQAHWMSVIVGSLDTCCLRAQSVGATLPPLLGRYVTTYPT